MSLGKVSKEIIALSLNLLVRNDVNRMKQLSDGVTCCLEDLRAHIDDELNEFMGSLRNNSTRINVARDLAKRLSLPQPRREEQRKKEKLLAWFRRYWPHIKTELRNTTELSRNRPVAWNHEIPDGIELGLNADTSYGDFDIGFTD